jgi:LPS export ABC transporter protein LptC
VKRADARAHRRAGARRAWRLLRASVPLCVCTSVLAACGPAERGVASANVVADSADQTMFGLTQILTNDGVRQAYLQADTAYMYEASGRVDLKHVKVTFYTASGDQESVLTGLTGTYWTRTNQMSAKGGVVVVRTSDQAKLRTEFLEYDPATNQVRTDQPYVADKGEQHFEGVGFVCDPGFVNCSTQQAKGNAGHLVMPAR